MTQQAASSKHILCCSPNSRFFFLFFFLFFCRNEKGLLNFASERINVVYRINPVPCTAFEKHMLPFKLSNTTIYRPHTPEFKSISKFQLLFHRKNFEKYMNFCTLPWSRWNITHKLLNTCDVPFAIAELGQKCLEAAPTLKYYSCSFR